MRLINKIFFDEIIVSVFDFDLKYVIKFEKKDLEQTFKVDKLEFKTSEEVYEIINNELLDSIKNRFSDMSSDLKKFYS